MDNFFLYIFNKYYYMSLIIEENIIHFFYKIILLMMSFQITFWCSCPLVSLVSLVSFIISFFVLFYFVVDSTYLFYLQAFNLSFPRSYVSLSFSSWGTHLVVISFMGMSCRRPSLSRPCLQFFYERDILDKMMMILLVICATFMIKESK